MSTANRYEGREPVTRRTHTRSWTADLETEAHASDRQLVVEEAIDAVNQTRPGCTVTLVTHERHGHPSSYLYAELRCLVGGISPSDEGRCSCGGYVTQVEIPKVERPIHRCEALHTVVRRRRTDVRTTDG